MQHLLGLARSKLVLHTNAALTVRSALPLLKQVKPAFAQEAAEALKGAPVVSAALALWDVGACFLKVSDAVTQQRATDTTARSTKLGVDTFQRANADRRKLRRADGPQDETQIAALTETAALYADTLIEARETDAKAAVSRSRRIILYIGAFRDVPLQLLRNALGMLSFAPTVGGGAAAAAAAAAIPSPVTPALNILNGIVNMSLGLLEWRHARAAEIAHGNTLKEAGELRSAAQIDLAKVAGRALRIKGRDKEIKVDPNGDLSGIYTKIHAQFEHAHGRSLRAARLSKVRACLQIAFGAATTPIGAATLAMVVVGAVAGTGGVALVVLPLVAAIVGLSWVVYQQRRTAADSKAATADHERDQRQHEQLQQLVLETANETTALEQRFLAGGEYGAGSNKFVAALLLARHLCDTGSPGRRKTAAAYLLATGMAPDIVTALKRLSARHDHNHHGDLIERTIEAHLLGGARRPIGIVDGA